MASRKGKVIITCALTGSVHTPSMSEHLPLTPDDIAEQAIDAASAGAAILHLHAREPETGRPTPDPAVFRQFVPRIAAARAPGRTALRPGATLGASGRSDLPTTAMAQDFTTRGSYSHLGPRQPGIAEF